MYFVTICTWQRECLFGEIIDRAMKLNEYGDVVANCWIQLINHYSHIKLDAHIIMPNHMHGIINIAGSVGAGLKPAPTTGRHDLPEIVRALKTFSSRQINILRDSPGVPVWQRNYFERVIRNEKELYTIRKYIQMNPLQWDSDKDNPVNIHNKL
jgi:putative transposase